MSPVVGDPRVMRIWRVCPVREGIWQYCVDSSCQNEHRLYRPFKTMGSVLPQADTRPRGMTPEEEQACDRR